MFGDVSGRCDVRARGGGGGERGGGGDGAGVDVGQDQLHGLLAKPCICTWKWEYMYMYIVIYSRHQDT